MSDGGVESPQAKPGPVREFGRRLGASLADLAVSGAILITLALGMLLLGLAAATAFDL